MATIPKPAQQNPWGGMNPANGRRAQMLQPMQPQQNAVNIPNMQAIGNVGGTGEPLMPQIPDYLSQVGQKFNDFQPLNLGNTPDFSNIFSGIDAFQQKMGSPTPISTGDVISPQQLDQMMNSGLGSNINQEQSALRDAVTQMGNRGFTSESPALQATANRLGLNRAIADTQLRVDLPLRVARENADHRLQAEALNQNQRSQEFQNFTALEDARTGRLSPLLGALIGLV